MILIILSLFILIYLIIDSVINIRKSTIRIMINISVILIYSLINIYFLKVIIRTNMKVYKHIEYIEYKISDNNYNINDIVEYNKIISFYKDNKYNIWYGILLDNRISNKEYIKLKENMNEKSK